LSTIGLEAEVTVKELQSSGSAGEERRLGVSNYYNQVQQFGDISEGRISQREGAARVVSAVR
jgi:hypothetical protein